MNSYQLSEESYKELAKELEFLRYFYEVADFGPADHDVREIIIQSYVDKGGEVPDDFRD